jgi:hypothetical protein
MKKHTGIIPAVIAILVLLGGCKNLLEPSDGGGGAVPGGKGRVEIRIADNARTALPSAVFDRYVLRFAYTGAEDYAHEPVEWSAGLSVDLEAGEWVAYVDAYIGPAISGTGSATVTVSAGTVAPITIRIGLNEGAGIQGTLKYKVSYPAAGHAYDTQTLSVRDTGGNAVGSPETITNGAEGFLQLDPGVYFVGVVINDTAQRTGAARTSAAHIYGGQETYLEIEIGEDEFTALVPITVAAVLTASDGITMSSRAAAAYSDPACTALLAAADTTTLTGQAAITLWAPSASAGVYVRQEVVVNGVTLNGKPKLVTIADPALLAAVSLDDTLYRISLAPGIPAGTVTTTAPAAFEGDSVGVTVTPGDTRTLKSGTLRYSDGTNDTSITGTDPDYTFVMPNADVTVQAEFYQFVRYGKAGGAGDGLSWETASDDIQKMMDELRVISLDNATGYTGPYIVKLGAGTYKPKYEPMVPSVPAVLENYAYNESPGDTRDKAFILREGVQVWGGYTAGGEDIGETERTGRFGTYGEAAPAHKAILSGDIGTENDATDNAYHVVLGVNIPANSDTVLDGLTISGGNANGGGTDISVGGKSIYRDSGGGMYNSASSPALIRVTVSGNKAGYGGGMHNESGSSPTLDNVTISGNTVSDSGSGGGMYNYGSGSSPELNNVMIGGASATDKNTAYNGGGMANNDSASPTLNNVTIFGNTASVNGGGIYNSGSSSLTLDNVTIGGSGPGQENTATNGGGIYNLGGSTLNITGVLKISGNKANSNGGGIYNNSPLALNSNVTISGNEAVTSGGGVYVASGTFTKSGGIIYGFNETDTDLKNTAGSGDGHAVYVSTGPLTRNSTAGTGVTLNSTIAGPSGGWGLFSGDIQGLINAASSGGTVTLSAATYDMESQVEINGKTITITTEPGAAVILKRDSATPFTGDMIKVTAGGLTLDAGTGGSLTLDGNKDEVTANGSLVRVESTGSLTMNTGVTLQKNKTTGDGGGVYMAGGTFTMTGGSIILNEAGITGGGMYTNGITSSSTMANVTISDNKAGNGGGMFNQNSSPVLDKVTISGNAAISYGNEDGGGGMYNNYSSPVLTNVTISGNMADVPYAEGHYAGGGGMYNNSSSPVLINVTISGNTANVNADSFNNDGGGGMYNRQSDSIPVLINVIIAGNKTVGSEAKGGGIHNNYDSSLVIRNSIIWGNTSSNGYPGIYNYNLSSIEYSMVEDESGGTGNQSAPSPVNAVNSPFADWKDPASYTMPNSDGDYRLNNTANADNAKNYGNDSDYPIDSNGNWNTASPVYMTLSGLPEDIQAMLLEVLQNDLCGEDRFNGTIDMGAYEW